MIGMKNVQFTRRTILKSLAIVPVAGISLPSQTVQAQFLLDESAEAQMTVSAHPTVELAEKWRLERRTRAFDELGEWYEDEPVGQELPADLASLPGSLVRFDYRFGEAGEHKSMLLGTFRNETIACRIRLDGEVDYLHELASFFAEQEPPGPFALAWSPTQLQTYMPTTETLGMSVTESDYFWP